MAAEDWLVGFLRDFASLSEEERDVVIDTLRRRTAMRSSLSQRPES